ncbi:MAG: hypothetical protein QXU98_11210, partial [Candidatus Parvarchaeota archaeon]
IMKFSEIYEPSGGWKNTTDSYFYVLGIYGIGFINTTSPGTNRFDSGVLLDPNGNDVDQFISVIGICDQLSGSMPVWNGSSVVNESFSYDLTQYIIVQRYLMLIPPGYTFKNFSLAIGFWLTPKEVEQMILNSQSRKIDILR